MRSPISSMSFALLLAIALGCVVHKTLADDDVAEQQQQQATATRVTTLVPGCFSSTKSLFDAMSANSKTSDEDDDDDVQTTTYIMCPNTVIDIGEPDENGNCCVHGDYSLMLRSQSTVQCGANGKSSNHCVLRGGNTQLFYIGAVFGDEIAKNVNVVGMTFDGAEFVSTAMANRGDITFTDCIWKNQKGAGTIFIAYSPPYNRRRLQEMPDPSSSSDVAKYVMSRDFQKDWFQTKLSESTLLYSQNGNQNRQEDTLGHLRRLQEEEEEEEPQEAVDAWTMLTTFENCQFLDNQQGDPSRAGIPLFGVIAVVTPFSPVVIRNSLFERNVYNGQQGGKNGYAIQTLSSLTINDSCFENNHFVGFGPVQVFGGAALESSGNFVADDNDLLHCNFAATSQNFTPDIMIPRGAGSSSSSTTVTCHESELSSCAGLEKAQIKD